MQLSWNEITELQQLDKNLTSLLWEGSLLMQQNNEWDANNLLKSTRNWIQSIQNTDNNELKSKLDHDTGTSLGKVRNEIDFILRQGDTLEVYNLEGFQKIKNKIHHIKHLIGYLLFVWWNIINVQTISIEDFLWLFNILPSPFETDIDWDIKIPVGLIYNILHNCMDNSWSKWKASDIKIHLSIENNNLIINIQDNGNWIDIDPIEQILESWFSLSNSTWIWLSNTHKQLEKIWATIEILGHGWIDWWAKFIITIPQ